MKRILAIAIMISLAACRGGGERRAGDGGGGGKELIIALDSAPTNLDPRVGNSQVDGRMYDLACSGLVRLSVKNEWEPDLAERWEMPDPRTIIFHLRPNLKFQDGKPLTAKDVEFTYESLMRDDFTTVKKSGYATVASFEAPDDRTFIMRLTEPNAGIFDNLSLGIVPQGADTNTYKSKPICAGPYRIIEYRTDDRVVLEAFDGYHGGAPNIKQVVARVIPDATTRVLELRQGGVNFGLNVVPYDQVNLFKQNDDFKVTSEPGAIYQYLAFNLRDPILRKKEVRQAIAHAIDRDRIVRDLLLGYGKVTETLFPEGHWARTENLPTNPYDVNRAKQLLDKAGHRDRDGDGPQGRFKLIYRTSTDAESNQQAQMIQQMLKQVGVDVEIQSSELGTFLEDVGKGNFQMFSLRRAGALDPDFYSVIFHSKSMPPEGQNRGFYSNARVDQLIEQGRQTTDRAERTRIYGEIQRILAEDLPYVSLYHRANVAIMRDNINGFVMYPAGFLLSVPKMTIE